MKIFLSYQQTGIEKSNLEKDLNFFIQTFDSIGVSHYIYYLDEKDNIDKFNVCKKAKEEIKNSDLVIAYINYPKRSEGMLLELGIAYGLGKEIKIFINNKFKNDYLLIYGLTKEENIIYFDELDEIEKVLKKIV